MSHNPLISVIIPCYNMEEYVGETLRSVVHQNADAELYECIVVNDGSTDGSRKVIDRFVESIRGPHPHINVLHVPNGGVAAARNLAISVARGEWILPLDADDGLYPGAIHTLSRHIMIEPETALFVPARMVRRPDGTEILQLRHYQGYEDLKLHCTPSNTSCFKKVDWESVGKYRDGTMYEDWEFWIRLLYPGRKVVNIDAPLSWYLIRDGSRWHQAVKGHAKEVMLIHKMNPEIFGE